MAMHELRRPNKCSLISNQQKRRDLSLIRQNQSRRDAQERARCLASAVLSFQSDQESISQDIDIIEVDDPLQDHSGIYEVRQSSKLRGLDARRWFAKQLMLHEWMVDIPSNLNTDWFVFARPAGKRCFVVSSNGTTVSRLRSGHLLHRFPSALPSGARNNNKSANSYSILDCIFHEADQTYYVIDMVCWAGLSFHECTADCRNFWLRSKLVEDGACDAPSTYHRFRFSSISIYDCDRNGLQKAYTEVTPFVKDGLLFFNKHAHYQTVNTPLALVWKDENSSRYIIDTDRNGQALNQQQVVLELLGDGNVVTSDDPYVRFGCLLNGDFIQEQKIQVGDLIRFSVNNEGLSFANGNLEKADLQYLGKVPRARNVADSFSKIMFQYLARSTPLKIEHISTSISSFIDVDMATNDVEIVG